MDGPGPEENWAVGRGWLGGLTLGLAGAYGLGVTWAVWALQQGNLGLAALGVLGFGALFALGVLTFLVLGVALLAGASWARDGTFWVNVVVAGIAFPVTTIPHGLVAWLARKRGSFTSEPSEEPSDPSPGPGPEAGDDELPFGLALLVGTLGLGGAAILVEGGLLFVVGRGDLALALLAIGSVVLGLLFGWLAWGLTKGNRWSWIGVQALAGVFLLAGLVEPWALTVGIPVLWYLRKEEVAGRFEDGPGAAHA